MVVHAAAPCPVEVKRQMIDWWGPIINEYYAGSEGNGFCAINSEQALVASRFGRHAADGHDPHLRRRRRRARRPARRARSGSSPNSGSSTTTIPRRRRAPTTSSGWSSLGDIGYLDDDGFLYLTDRASHMIISGGVNIYPQEVENELALHPAVADVAVIGVPNADLGEEVKAVVIAADPARPATSSAPS